MQEKNLSYATRHEHFRHFVVRDLRDLFVFFGNCAAPLHSATAQRHCTAPLRCDAARRLLTRRPLARGPLRCIAANELTSLGARRVFAFATHGLFSSAAAERIEGSALEVRAPDATASAASLRRRAAPR